MAKTFLDKNLLVWEVYSSTGAFGFPENPKIVFNCLTNRAMRARVVEAPGDEADAAATLQRASTKDLLEMFEGSREMK